MASKRTLKRTIHSIFSILKVEDEFIRRASHPEPGLTAKAYFKDLKDNFTAQIGDIIDQLNS